MTNTINETINKVFSGIKMTNEQKNALAGMYLIGVFKSMLETLFTLKSQDKGFFRKTSVFFDAAVATLDEEKRKVFNTVIEKEKSRITGEILVSFKENLPPELRQKIEVDMTKLSSGNATLEIPRKP